MSEVLVRGASRWFGPVVALSDCDLRLAPGELTAVLGPSGCGKTTLLRIVAGFLAPDAGTVHIDGRLVADPHRQVPPERRGVGVVPQEGALFPHLDVAGNVAFGLRAATRRGDGVTRRVAELLELVGMAGFERRRPQELSGGQQQRVALARALAPRPAVVMLDEPFSALDAGLRAQVRADVRQALHYTGSTAVLITHDQDEALSCADSVAVMNLGRVLMHGSPAEVYRRPTSLTVARFVGDLVELPARLDGDHADTALGRLPLIWPAGADRGRAGGRLVAGLRPEQLVVDELAAPRSPDRIAARVVAVAYHGHDALATLQVHAGPTGLAPNQPPVQLRARTSGPLLTEGATVGLRVDGPALGLVP